MRRMSFSKPFIAASGEDGSLCRIVGNSGLQAM